MAAESGNKGLVEYLIGKGLKINAKNSYDQTILDKAVKSGNKDLVEYLIGKGVDINAEHQCAQWLKWNNFLNCCFELK